MLRTSLNPFRGSPVVQRSPSTKSPQLSQEQSRTEQGYLNTRRDATRKVQLASQVVDAATVRRGLNRTA